MPKFIEGQLNASGMKFGLVVGRFNDFITERLLGGAMDALIRSGASDDDITVARVPGGWEIPLATKKMAENDAIDAVICLGCVIKGSTPHFEYVANEAAKGIAQISLESGKVITFGVLTTDNLEQAIERAGSKAGNKGYDAAMAAIEMVDLLRRV